LPSTDLATIEVNKHFVMYVKLFSIRDCRNWMILILADNQIVHFRVYTLLKLNS